MKREELPIITPDKIPTCPTAPSIAICPASYEQWEVIASILEEKGWGWKCGTIRPIEKNAERFKRTDSQCICLSENTLTYCDLQWFLKNNYKTFQFVDNGARSTKSPVSIGQKCTCIDPDLITTGFTTVYTVCRKCHLER